MPCCTGFLFWSSRSKQWQQSRWSCTRGPSKKLYGVHLNASILAHLSLWSLGSLGWQISHLGMMRFPLIYSAADEIYTAISVSSALNRWGVVSPAKHTPARKKKKERVLCVMYHEKKNKIMSRNGGGGTKYVFLKDIFFLLLFFLFSSLFQTKKRCGKKSSAGPVPSLSHRRVVFTQVLPIYEDGIDAPQATHFVVLWDRLSLRHRHCGDSSHSLRRRCQRF